MTGHGEAALMYLGMLDAALLRMSAEELLELRTWAERAFEEQWRRDRLIAYVDAEVASRGCGDRSKPTN